MAFNNTSKKYDIVILGIGASGLSAAVTLYELSCKTKNNPSIALVEADSKIGKSILRTGNGRCNFSNIKAESNTSENIYNNHKYCNEVFNRTNYLVDKLDIFQSINKNYSKNSVIKMFNNLGLMWVEESDGKLYPYTKKAITVLDVFLIRLSKTPFKIINNFQISNISVDNHSSNLSLRTQNGKTLLCKNLIISCGNSVTKINSDIFRSLPIKPKLLPLKTDTQFLKNLDGIRCKVNCALYNNKELITTEKGEILFRKYGVSGICIFNLSRYVNDNKNQYLTIDFFPDISVLNLTKILKIRHQEINNSFVDIIELTTGMILPDLAKRVADKAAIDHSNVKEEDLKKLCKNLKCFKLKVKGLYEKQLPQVYRGGIPIKDINHNTMKHKFANNMYFAGEAIDVDGPCGGYNLHWAWSSGILAAINAFDNLGL